ALLFCGVVWGAPEAVAVAAGAPPPAPASARPVAAMPTAATSASKPAPVRNSERATDQRTLDGHGRRTDGHLGLLGPSLRIDRGGHLHLAEAHRHLALSLGNGTNHDLDGSRGIEVGMVLLQRDAGRRALGAGKKVLDTAVDLAVGGKALLG